MSLKMGDRQAIQAVVNEQLRPAQRRLTIVNSTLRVETSNKLATKADIAVTNALAARLDVAEAAVVALEAADVGLDARVDANETNLVAQAAVDVDHETRIAAGEAALPLKLQWSTVPASATATGTAGQLAYEAGFLYVCVAADTWQRVAIATWP